MPRDAITPELLAVARGEAGADILLTGARILNVFSGEVLAGCVAIHKERIASVTPEPPAAAPKQHIDVRGAFISPGFIDAHMHVESTMLPPSEFVRLAAPHGTTGVVLDPHEIANVLGIPGMRALMDDAAGARGAGEGMNFYFALSSCVPSCHLETSGARIEAGDLSALFDDPRVVALAEMMNFPGVVHADPGVLAKVNLGLERRIVDGHAPGLRGAGLQAYAAAGISSDHECVTLEEAREKLRLGMQIYIREGSAARNLEALLPLVTPANHGRFCFCTDDRHPADLRDEGHIDHIVRKAIRLGLDPVLAITIGSINTARHYRRRGVGAVAPGYQADLCIFDDLASPAPREVYFKGALVARDGEYLPARGADASTIGARFPRSAVKLPADLTEASFRVAATSASGRIRIIGMDPHQLVTTEIIEKGAVEAGAYVADVDRDILKLAVIERHQGSGNIGLGFIRGFGLARGALASTVGHDSHNLAVVGTNDADMLIAAQLLSECGGGQCAVLDGAPLALLPLPIAGLMSNQSADKVIEYQRALLEATRALGCPHHDPFMPLSFMPLPVIPKLKLSDLGLVDVDTFALVSVEADG